MEISGKSKKIPPQFLLVSRKPAEGTLKRPKMSLFTGKSLIPKLPDHPFTAPASSAFFTRPAKSSI